MKSKFIEALKKLSQTSVSPMGFGRQKEGHKAHPLLLIASYESPLEGQAVTTTSKLDAVIFSGSKIDKDSLKEHIKAHPAPAGILLRSVEDLADLKENGVDFLVFSSQGTEASILKTELGKVMEIDMNLPDSQMRSVDFLPVDALLLPFSGKEASLTVQNLMAYQRIDLLVTKPLLGYMPAKISGENLRLLWEAGLDGIVIKGDELTPKEMERLQEAIKSFPPHRGEKKRADALLPSLASTIPEEPEDESE